MNAGRSSGVRDVTRFPSTTTSSSLHLAPAWTRSSRIARNEVRRFPFTMSAEARTHPAWQIAATTLPAAFMSLTNARTASDIRSLSGAHPPGITTPIHDHRAWCAFGVYDGVVRETRFAPAEERAGVCYAAPVETVACAAGCVRHLPADRPDIHAMHNPGDRAAISIHVYGEDAARLGPNVEKVYSPVG